MFRPVRDACSDVRRGKYLYADFPVHSDLKHGDTLPLILFNVDLVTYMPTSKSMRIKQGGNRMV